MEIDKYEVGQRIKAIRLSKGKNLREFGELISKGLSEQNIVSDSIVSRWEKGVSIPNAKRLKKIAELGNITPNELLHGSNFTYEDIEKNITTKIMKDEITDKLSRFLKSHLFRSKFNVYAEKTVYLIDIFLDDLNFDIEELIEKIYLLISDERFSFYQYGVFSLLNENFNKLHVQIYLTEYIYNLLVQISLDYPIAYYNNLLLQIDEAKENIKDISKKKDVYKDYELKYHLTEFVNRDKYMELFDDLDKIKSRISNKEIIKDEYKEWEG